MAELKSRLSEGCIDFFSHAQYMENGKSAHDKIEQGGICGQIRFSDTGYRGYGILV